MKFETFKHFVEQIKGYEEQRQEYLDKIPSDINAAFFDNEYCNLSGLMFDEAMKAALTPELYEDVCWFLWDWKPGFEISTPEGKKHVINNINDYFTITKEYYEWD